MGKMMIKAHLVFESALFYFAPLMMYGFPVNFLFSKMATVLFDLPTCNQSNPQEVLL